MNDENKRLEIKFKIHKNFQDQILNYIDTYYHLNSPYGDREVNSIYLDTKNLYTAQMNLDGLSKRKKLRFRYYGDFFEGENKEIIFEVKKKDNNFGFKLLKKINLNTKNLEKISYNLLKKKLLNNLSIINLDSLITSLHVRYERSYYTLINDLRVTIDKNISFSDPQINSFLGDKCFINYDYDIIEIKTGNQIHLKKFLKSFPLKHSRHSKYLTGLEIIGIALY